MNAKAFLVDALTSALELNIATPFDVIRHVTPDVLAEHLPRPLWARLFTACLGAPKVDAQLIVETIGVSNLCEHVPTAIMWGVIAEIGARSLGQAIPDRPIVASKSEPTMMAGTKTEPTKAASTPATGVPTTTKRPPAMTPPKPLAVASPPPVETKTSVTPAPPPPGPSIPAPSAATSDDDEARMPTRARTPTGQRFRQTSTNIGRLAANQRRPQASAAAPEPPTSATQPTPTVRGSRPPTEIDVEIETEIGNNASDWRNAIAIEDDQLVDWSTSEETQTSTDDAAFGKRRP